MIKRVVCLIALLPLAVTLRAQGGETHSPKHATAVRVEDGSIQVDGRLDEPAWSQASPISDFIQKEPDEGAEPSEKTEIRLVYTGSALYVGARMHKRTGSSIQAPMGRRDQGEQSEYLVVALDTFHDHRTAYVFGVTAAGVRLDRFHSKDDETSFDEGFDPVWRARTSADAQGWTAELWIPFSQLRFNAGLEQVWGLNVNRSIPDLIEEDYWVPVPRTAAAWASRFGHLEGIQGLTSNRRIEALPYVAGSSSITSDQDPFNPFDRGGNLEGRAGADFKMGVGPNLTLDLTFNPDFGQVEADPAEVNLSTSETTFAEKRPFFSEGAALLNITAANNFFYSRRIGAAPAGPASGDFLDYPRETTIIGAGKLTGRLASGTSVGILAALTDEEDAQVYRRSSNTTSRVRVAPRSVFTVGRVQQEFGRNKSTISGMLSSIHRDLEPGDPLASLLVRDAFGLATESILRFKGGEYELISYGGMTYLKGEEPAIARVQRSSVHYAHRPDRDYDPYDPTRRSLQGYKVGFLLQRIGGRHWIWSFANADESPMFEANDFGRVNSADGMTANTDVRYRETIPGKLFRSYWVGARQLNEWNYGGNRQVGTVEFYSNQVWKNYWNTQSTFTRDFRHPDAKLTRGGPLMQTPLSWKLALLLRNRTSAKTTWSGEVTAGGTEDGGQTRQFIGKFTFRPGPSWQLSVDPNLLRQIDTQQYVTSLDGGRATTYGRRYVFSAIDRHTYSVQFRLNYTFKPDLNLDVYAEPFAASGRYYNHGELAVPATRLRRTYGLDTTTAVRQPDGSLLVTDAGSIFRLNNTDFNVHSFRCNVVLRWEWRPGSTLYLVWQQDRHISEPISSAIGLSDPFRSLTVPGNHYFVVKTSFWLPF